MKNLVILFLICIFATACGSIKYIEKEVPIEVIKYKYINNTTHDSIYIKDSIFTMLKQDTIFTEKWHTKYISIIKKDTIHQVDSIPYIQTITNVKEVNKLDWYQKFFIYLGEIATLILVILVIFKSKIKLWI